ncbi:MAG: hypothetical protein OHK0045_09520 [Raineya sp.]
MQSCNTSNTLEKIKKTSLEPDRAMIQNLINAFDGTLREGVELKAAKVVIDETRLQQIFLNHLSDLGVTVESATPQNYSNQYFNYIQNIALCANFNSSEDFIAHLQNLQEISKNSTELNFSEIQNILDKSEFMIRLVEWIKNNQDLFEQSSQKCSGWWSCWGKCVAGIAGGAITGGLGGAAAGSIVPVLGTGWGAALGAVGGGLTGAATFCD